MKNIVARKNSSYHKEYLKVTIVSLIVVCIAAFFAITHVNRRVNSRFEHYIQTVTLSEEYLDGELEMLIRFLEEPTLSSKNRGIASNYISIMYGFKKQTRESLKYICRALYYFEKAHENSSLVQAMINLSTILMSTTSYDMVESVLQYALDIELLEEEQGRAQLFIYLNLAEARYYRNDYAQTLEAIELAEARMKEIEYEEWCEFSLNITKARTYFAMENYKESEEAVAIIQRMVEANGSKLLEYFALQFYEISSMVALHNGDIEKAKFYFDEYVAYCELYQYELMKLLYVDKYISIALQYGYQNEKFIQENEAHLLNEYREQLSAITNANNRIMMEMYNTSVDNMRIQSELSIRRGKVYAGIILVILITVIVIALIIQIYRSSRVDFLTGAYNRKKLRSVYRKLLAKKRQFYVIMFDIDNFKMCNDCYGHRFGDTVLEQVSANVMHCIPKASLFFRYGGEEFVVLCELKGEEVKELAEMIRRTVEELEWENQSRITISIGVARSGSHEDPLKVADECLYISKKMGKNKATYGFV